MEVLTYSYIVQNCTNDKKQDEVADPSRSSSEKQHCLLRERI